MVKFTMKKEVKYLNVVVIINFKIDTFYFLYFDFF